MSGNSLPILDCHQHFYDARRLRYPVFAQRSAGFEAVVGDYSALPRVYLVADYAQDTGELNVVKTVWAEFISDDPVSEGPLACCSSTRRKAPRAWSMPDRHHSATTT
jgi:predicted TIM-barrel fold metal-dependent hydrolase